MRTSLVVLMVAAAGCGGGDEADPTFIAWGSSTTSVTLRWQPVDGAVGYLLERVGRDAVALEATDLGYYDHDLSVGSYSYRLTALSPEAKVQETSATTSEDPAIITVDDPPLGAPVVATIGSAGGTIEFADGSARAMIPAGALPDGATVTLQAIASPAGDEGLAIDVSSDIAFAGPIDVSFAIDPVEQTNTVVAEKQDDGTWVTVAGRSDGERAIVTLSDSEAPARFGAKLTRKLVKLRKVTINPTQLKVTANAQRMLVARAYFSNDACPDSWLGPCGDPIPGVPGSMGQFLGGEVIVNQPALKNGDGRWVLGGPGKLSSLTNGTTTYTAPSSKPSPNNWPITYTHKSGKVAQGYIHFVGNRFLVDFAYDNSQELVAGCLSAQVRDKVTIQIEVGDGASVAITSGPTNQPTDILTTPTPLPDWQSGMQTSFFDVIRVDTITCTLFRGNFASLECSAVGESNISSATCVDFSDPPKMINSVGSSTTYTLFFSLNGFVPEEILGDDKLFPIEGTNWRAFVTPLADDD